MVKTKYITIPQLAEILGISRIAVYRQVKTGRIKTSRIGKNFVVSDSDIINILSKKLSDKDKKQTDDAVKKVVQEYAGLLEMLGRE